MSSKIKLTRARRAYLEIAKAEGIEVISLANGGRHVLAKMRLPNGTIKTMPVPRTDDDWRERYNWRAQLRAAIRGDRR